MKLQYHLLASTLAAGGLYGLTRSWPAALTCWLSGFLIDLDHVLDYILVYRRLSPGHFFTVWHKEQIERIYLIGHAWEWVVLLVGLTLWSGGNPRLAGLTLGIGHHLLIDQLTNHPRPLGYSFFWRLTHGCSLRRAFKVKSLGGTEQERCPRPAPVDAGAGVGADSTATEASAERMP